MRIDGKQIAQEILERLRSEVAALSTKGILPKLAVILVGDNPASRSYIRQKIKTAHAINASVDLIEFPETVASHVLATKLSALNANGAIHGIIIQRPLPRSARVEPDTLLSVSKRKDVDGYIAGSPYMVPTAKAVLTILTYAHATISNPHNVGENFLPWLRHKRVVVVGRGQTAGKPVALMLAKYKCATSIVHSQSVDPELLLKKADIIISCVGKERVITRDTIQKGVILISVGLWRDSEGKLRGDYDDEEIHNIASHYTPTPGGVGPLNVASLMENLVEAAKRQTVKT